MKEQHAVPVWIVKGLNHNEGIKYSTGHDICRYYRTGKTMFFESHSKFPVTNQMNKGLRGDPTNVA
jgi:hypothetical protein